MRTLQRGQAPEGRAGTHRPPARPTNRWLRHTSSGWDQPQVTVDQRELVRRSQLTAWIILGLFVTDLILLPVGGGDPGTLVVLVVVALCLLVAVVLNRRGLVTAAGTLLVLMICGGVMASLLSDPRGLLLDAVPGYDLLGIAVVVAASVLPRAAAFVVAGINSVVICLDFYLQPHFFDLDRDLRTQFPNPTVGTLTMLARPIALQIILAVVAYLWVRGTDQAIRRADRAEEFAAVEHQLADQKRQLDIGIRQILETHVRAANGDFGARAPLAQENVLFQIAASLNNLLNRLGRAAQAEYYLQRTVTEINRLRDSLVAARAGRPPLWPAPSGTPVDSLIEVIVGPTHPLPPVGQFPAMSPPSGPHRGPQRMQVPGGTPPATPYPPASAYPTGTNSGLPDWAVRMPPSAEPEAPPANPWELPPLPDWPPPGSDDSGTSG